MSILDVDGFQDIITHCRGIRHKEGLYYIKQQPDFDLLQEAWQASPLVREIGEEIEQERMAEDRVRNMNRLSCLPLLTARARHALLDGRHDDFLRLYGRVRGMASVEWKVWQERMDFWHGVLGPRLSGAAAVPQSTEIQELWSLIYLRYAFHAPKAAFFLDYGQLPIMAKLANMLKQGQASPIANRELLGTTGAAEAAEAVQRMLGGDWTEAHVLFRKAFGPNTTIRYQLALNLGGPLLLYASLNAIQAGADAATIDCWLDEAGALLSPHCQPGKAHEDMCGMLHSLRLLDQIANRNMIPETLPDLQGPLTCFPLILCYDKLPMRLRASLPTEKLHLAIRKLEQAGLFLFARYARGVLDHSGIGRKSTPRPKETQPAIFRPLLQLQLQEGDLNISVLHELEASPEYLLKPGEGEDTLLIQTPKGPRLLHRRKGDEEQAALKFWQSHPILAEGEPGGRFSCRFKGIEQSLCALSRLMEKEAPLHWQGPAIKLLAPPQEALSLTHRNSAGQNIELDARLSAGGMAWPLSDFLAAFQFRCGRYLPISRCLYLPLPDRHLAQMEALAEYTRINAHHVEIAPAALPALAAECGDALPPTLRRYMQILDKKDSPLPEGLEADLRPYQKEGYDWLLAHATARLGGCLADDMGLGKTIQMLALLLQRAALGPSLIVAPLSLLHNWAMEARIHTPALKVSIFNPAGKWKRPKKGELVLVSYGQLVNHARLFALTKWNIVALDEAQAIKNPLSQRASAVQKLQAKSRFCLTGTPIENGLMDLWSIMNFLNPGLLGTQDEFLFRYNAANPAALQHLKRLIAPLILRRTKTQLLPQLAPLTEWVAYLDFTPRERTFYDKCLKEARKRLSSSQQASPTSVLAELTLLRRLCCHPRLYSNRYRAESSKIAALVDRLYRLKEAGHRALVFSQFTDVLDLAEYRLKKYGISYLRLDGSLSATKSQRRIREFQAGDTDAFLISLKAGGTGLNLTAADYVILLDPWWNPAVEEQAIGRSHRQGQGRAVTVYRLIVRDTVEERILALHEKKKELSESLISEGAVSLDELMGLLGESPSQTPTPEGSPMAEEMEEDDGEREKG